MTLRSAFLVVAALLLALTPARAQTSQEGVKATFVYRFASFVRWPETAFADAASPIRICVIGASPFAHTLENAVASQHAGARAFEVRQVTAPADIDGCHAVYVVGERTEATLREARRRAVLTITDGGGARGMIHFVLVHNRVRFHIDDARAAESGLSIDPRLLSLGISVRRRATS